MLKQEKLECLLDPKHCNHQETIQWNTFLWLFMLNKTDERTCHDLVFYPNIIWQTWPNFHLSWELQSAPPSLVSRGYSEPSGSTNREWMCVSESQSSPFQWVMNTAPVRCSSHAANISHSPAAAGATFHVHFCPRTHTIKLIDHFTQKSAGCWLCKNPKAKEGGAEGLEEGRMEKKWRKGKATDFFLIGRRQRSAITPRSEYRSSVSWTDRPGFGQPAENNRRQLWSQNINWTRT